MKIALVQPKIPDGNYMPSLGLLYIAAVLEQDGFTVKVFDENYDLAMVDSIIEFSPSVVGFTAVTAAINSSVSLAGKIKNKTESVTVVGGAHPTAMPEETAERDGIDYVVYGEGERAMLDLCKAIDSSESRDFSDIENICYKSDGKIIKTKKAKFLTGEELDELPYPAFHLLNIDFVFKNSAHGLFSIGKRVLSIMTSRGCPQVCSFCCRMMGFSLRTRSVPLVIKEIKFLSDTYNIDELYIEDDNFCNNKERALEILDGIVELNLDIPLKFANGLRADTVDRELLSKIKEAGGYWVGFGIESGSKRILELMKKNLDLDLARENVKLAKSMGFFVGSNFIVGFPEETVDDLKESIRYFLSLGLDSCAAVNLIPFPKTVVYAECKKKGYLTKEAEDYSNYYFRIFNPNVLVSTPHLTPEMITKTARYFFLRFYLRPDRFYRIIRMILRRYGI